MKTRLFWLLISVSIVGLLMLGCAPQAAPQEGGGGATTAPAEEEEEEGPSAPAGETYTFKIQTSFDAANPAHIYGAKICDAVTAMSNGRLEFQAFTGGSIVPATKEMDAIDVGTIDGTYTCTMYNLDKWPEAGLFSARPGGLREIVRHLNFS